MPCWESIPGLLKGLQIRLCTGLLYPFYILNENSINLRISWFILDQHKNNVGPLYLFYTDGMRQKTTSSFCPFKKGGGEIVDEESRVREKRNNIDLHKYDRIILYIIIIRQGLESRSQLTGLKPFVLSFMVWYCIALRRWT